MGMDREWTADGVRYRLFVAEGTLYLAYTTGAGRGLRAVDAGVVERAALALSDDATLTAFATGLLSNAD